MARLQLIGAADANDPADTRYPLTAFRVVYHGRQSARQRLRIAMASPRVRAFGIN